MPRLGIQGVARCSNVTGPVGRLVPPRVVEAKDRGFLHCTFGASTWPD